MAPLPKKKMTKARSAKRRLASRVSLGALIKCASCGKLKEAHKACPHCGFYK